MLGYFVAPATAAYRFRMACDDYCEFRMGLNTSQPFETTQIMIRYGWSYSRGTFREGATVSDWHNLTGGQHYYMYARHLEGTGGDNFLVGVEIN